MSRFFVGVVGVVAAIASVSWAADDDAIRKKLNLAKEAYDQEMLKYQKLVDDYFEQREKVARNAGNKKLLDQIKAEVKAFEEKGELPTSGSGTLIKKSAYIRNKMEAAYSEALKSFVKAKNDEEASAVEKQMEEFVRNPIGMTAEDRTKKLTVGRWQRSATGKIYVFSSNGIAEELDAPPGKGKTNARWTVEKDGVLTFRPENGWNIVFQTITGGSLKGEVRTPQNTRWDNFELIRLK